MYNGIGLTTPRGSGTSGYVIRNLSTLRVHERKNESSWDAAPPKHREPDEGILEHERKRGVEIKCLELQLDLEDKGIDEEEVEKQVDQLRQKLLANLSASSLPSRGLKPSDTHALAAAKKAELSKMARALGTRADYQEGDAFDKEKQEENRLKRIAEREERELQKLEREKKRDEDRKKMIEQKAKWEEERREREIARRKEEDKRREDRAAGKAVDVNVEDKDRAMPPPGAPTGPRREYRDRDRTSEQEYRGPPRRPLPPRDAYPRGGRDGPRDMPPPPPPRAEPLSKRGRASPSLSPSPPPRNRRRVDSRSPSRSRSRSRSDSGSRSRTSSRSPSRSRSPMRGVDRSRRSRSRSHSPLGIVPPGPPANAYGRGRGGGRGYGGRGRGGGDRDRNQGRYAGRGRRSPSRTPSRSPSRSRSPPPNRSSRRYASRSPSRSPPPTSSSRRPQGRGGYRSRTPPPPSRLERTRTPPYLQTPSGKGPGSVPPRDVIVRDAKERPAPPPLREDKPARRGRSRSASTGSSMSVSTRSGGSRSRSKGRD